MQTWVIKLGGAVLNTEDAAKALFEALASQTQAQFVIVHGGGSLVDNWLTEAGFASAKHQGLRISPKEQMPYIVGALAGCANKQLMSQAIIAGHKPVGLSLYEAGIISSQKLKALGQVGNCDGGVQSVIPELLKLGRLPLVSSIGFGEDGLWYNVNADEAAAAIAKELNAEIIFMTDVEAVLDANKQPLHQLDTNQINTLIAEGVILGGMEVKVKTSLLAAQHLRRGVYISSWQKPENLIALLAGEHVGTKITP
ncbi:acetylglutamate kinase [Pseudoalteromonas sp. SR44-5]|jgi:acetylglutamate kinase|uniref:Acetylglutamate kinase n=2 Tax=Pseudoalteromonas TaxID=53246 RepID=A0ABY3FFH1_9GAMM|nr:MULTISPECIES: acetylglutamate kinase [Pseudoalteromonas]MBB1293965.1 acetylglutamate kinase [Pseudoalteromonas sp. SR41-4]MBB1302014.1 acetylglutamate kinase [Pseudoalteromonas sp. SR44-8]MBB1310525.1 acetylglutamate kinase [Pseudoalteromonas sp. SR41-8]MBB1367030.1 acetylglutamate kinase [Pseudoalteromonas sp. SR44-5]MBB1398648.1 acetylglutamate kinase [Pseudoalteromonas sp. SG44-8]|tara:strand:- start:21623 stop:22384 length:762 start_codon:yes stop_codon:yes gene_type:complete